MDLYSFVFEPFSLPFMQRALLVALLVGSATALLSCFLVLKGWSLMGDAVSHAVLPGIVLAVVLGAPLALGAFLSGLLCAFATGYIHINSRLKEDTVLGIVFSGLFALGLVMFVKVETDQHLLHVLFGNLLGVRPNELWQLAAIAVPVMVSLLVFRRSFMLFVFDPIQARTMGLPVGLLYFGLLALLAATAVAALQAVGVILVVAMLVTPGATAFLISRRFDAMLAIALFISIFSSICGLIFSFHMNLPTGPLIVVTQFVFFLVALLASVFHQRQARLRIRDA